MAELDLMTRTEFRAEISDFETRFQKHLETLIKPKGYLRLKEAAQYLAISDNALYKLACANKVTFSQEQVGSKMYFHVDWLDEYREKHSIKAIS